MTSRCSRPCYDLTEVEEEEDLCVLTTGSFPKMAAVHWAEEEEVHFDHEEALDHGC